MEQYAANSNSSTEQIVVQAGQIQQQVGTVLTGELALLAPSGKAVCAPQSFTEQRDAARCCRDMCFLSFASDPCQ